MRNEDDAARKSYMEDLLKEYVPVGIDVELKNQPEWKSSSPTLDGRVRPEGAWDGRPAAGKRALVPTGLFSATEKQVFEHANRVHPIYFHFPFEKDGRHYDPTAAWLAGEQLAEAAKQRSEGGGLHAESGEREGNAAHHADAKERHGAAGSRSSIRSLRGFYQTVKSGDEEQVMVQPGAAVAVQ